MPSIFAGYDTWVTNVKNFLDIDDVSDAQIQTFISLAQIRLNRELASYPMEKQFAYLQPAVPVDPLILTTLIPDFNKIRLVVPDTNAFPMNALAINEFMSLLAAQAGGLPDGMASPWLSSIMGNYAIDAGILYMNPIPPENANITIFYYIEVPPISATLDSNIFTDNNSDALLYASCLEGSAYIVEDDRLGMWQSKYADAVASANVQGGKIKLGSTVLKRSIKGLSR